MLSEFIKKGMGFVLKNPQVLYTFFLLVSIPVAFLFVSEQFLSISRDAHDRLERQRAALIGDVVGLFGDALLTAPESFTPKLRTLQALNAPLLYAAVYEEVPDGVVTRASTREGDIGKTVVMHEQLRFLFSSAKGDTTKSFTTETWEGGVRVWKTVRALANGERTLYLLLDISMAESDRLLSGNIRNAYGVLAVVIVLMVLLLARHARIIDYATLYRRLEEVDRLKDSFVAMAAHELRSPLTIIRGYADALRSVKRFPKDGIQFLDRIEQSSKQLNTLITDILDVAKLQEGRMEFHLAPLLVKDEVASIVGDYERVAADKKLELEFRGRSVRSILVDSVRFRQVVVNLVGNAIKYTPSGVVTVSVLDVGAYVEIRVSDTGIGISAENIERLFGRFVRIKSAETEKISGTGLGLWITKEIVTRMHGTIHVESITGKGSDFIVRFEAINHDDNSKNLS